MADEEPTTSEIEFSLNMALHRIAALEIILAAVTKKLGVKEVDALDQVNLTNVAMRKLDLGLVLGLVKKYLTHLR
jgi:hypothetical protein